MPTIGNSVVDLVVDPELIRKYGVGGRPYTCYPAPDQFSDAFDAAVYEAWLQERDRQALARPLALYVHLPLGKTYAGKDGAAWWATYLQHLYRELALVADCLTSDLTVAQLTWGGGSPTLLSDSQLIELLRAIRSTFRVVAPMADHSATIDPSTASVERIALLSVLGVNRLVVGAVDSGAELPGGAPWVPVIEQTERILRAARQARFRSVAVDLRCGLPGQDMDSFTDAMASALACAPDRVALRSPMRATGVTSETGVSAERKPSEAMVEMLTTGIERLQAAGYVYSAMDQFALPRDDLAKAQLQGRLGCDCRGYSTAGYGDTVGLGISAIGQVGPTYSQNPTILRAYYDLLDRGKLPVQRGIKLTRDDMVRRSVIEALICHFEVSMESIGIAYLIDFKQYFANELTALAQFVRDGMIEIDQDWISVTPRGKLFVRAICSVFDSRSR